MKYHGDAVVYLDVDGPDAACNINKCIVSSNSVGLYFSSLDTAWLISFCYSMMGPSLVSTMVAFLKSRRNATIDLASPSSPGSSTESSTGKYLGKKQY